MKILANLSIDSDALKPGEMNDVLEWLSITQKMLLKMEPKKGTISFNYTRKNGSI